MSFYDVFTFAAAMFVIAAVILVGYTGFQMIAVVDLGGELGAVNQTFTSPDNSSSFNPVEAGEQMFGIFDWGFLLLAVAFIIAMFFSGFMLPSHPIFTVVGLVLAIIWILVSPLLSNSWLLLVDGTILAEAATRFEIIHLFMMNLPIIGLFAGVISSILMYGKGIPR